MTLTNQPCFAYLVTGRSPASRERIATIVENTVRIGPLNPIQYDPLRHYSAVKWDNRSGVVSVSNGIQTEAIFELYKLIENTEKQPDPSYLEKILGAAGAEPDPPLNTARIAGVIVPRERENIQFLGIKAQGRQPAAWQVRPVGGELAGVSTYLGDLEKPVAPDAATLPIRIEFREQTAIALANRIFDISAASHKGYDIRVCAVAGVKANGRWDIAVKNVMLA
jgi:IMP cyclohydrolase